MLEYNFNKLDDDFITLWSNYLLYQDTGLIIEPLKQLAEKGQINAIQSWYLLKKEGEKSEIIDRIVDGYYGDSFNEALAIANRTYAHDKSKLNLLKEDIVNTHKKGKLLALRKYQDGIILEEGDNPHYKQRDDLIESFRNTEYAKQLTRAAELTEIAAQSSNSVLVWERLVELYGANPLILNPDRVNSKSHKNIRKALTKRLKDNTEDAVSKFSYAKNLLFFTPPNVSDLVSSRMLSELAKRPLKCCDYSNEQQFVENAYGFEKE